MESTGQLRGVWTPGVHPHPPGQLRRWASVDPNVIKIRWEVCSEFRGLTENAGHEIAGQNSVRPTLHYYEVCSCLLLLFS